MPPQMAMPYNVMQAGGNAANNNGSNLGVSPANAMSHQSLTMNNRQKNAFIREGQNQQSLRMNQMMAPSMPNIAHSSGYASNISASQSMQNVNMIHGNNGMNYHGYMQSQPGATNSQLQAQYLYQQELQQQQQQQQMQQQNSLARGQSKLLEMGEMLKRRQQRQQEMMPMLDVSGQPIGQPMMLSPTGSQSEHHHPHLGHGALNKSQSNIGGYMQNTPMSPVKQLPPTAPKPQVILHVSQRTILFAWEKI